MVKGPIIDSIATMIVVCRPTRLLTGTPYALGRTPSVGPFAVWIMQDLRCRICHRSALLLVGPPRRAS